MRVKATVTFCDGLIFLLQGSSLSNGSFAVVTRHACRLDFFHTETSEFWGWMNTEEILWKKIDWRRDVGTRVLTHGLWGCRLSQCVYVWEQK